MLTFALGVPPSTTIGGISRRRETRWRAKLAPLQGAFQRFAEYAIPSLPRLKLLRSLAQTRQEARDPSVGAAGYALLTVRAGDGQRDLPGMLGLPRDRLHQQRTAGDRLGPVIEVGETDEQAPPVEDQRNTAGEQPAPLQVVCCETTPAPLVLQFVERVLAIAPIAVQLAQRDDLAVQRGHQRGVFPHLPIRPDLGKAEQWLLRLGAVHQHQRPIELAAQQHDTALSAPAHQPQRRLLALPAMAG